MPAPTPRPGALMLPAIFDRCVRRGEVTPDGRLVYSTDSIASVLLSRCGFTPEQARAWLLRVTTDTSPGTPDFLD
jgi:hypothetical protein